MAVVDRELEGRGADSRTRRGSASTRAFRPDLNTLLGVSVALIGAGIGARRLSDNSFLTHLASGREMVEEGIIRSDQFTWTSGGDPVVLQSWFASLLYGVVDAATGLGGVRLLMAASAAVLALLSWVATARSPSLVTRMTLMVPVLLIGLRTWSERPLLLGLIALASVLLVAEGRGRPAWLVALGAVWVNVHGSWPLGLALLAARAVGARLDGESWEGEARAAKWLGAGLAIGGFLNPYGPEMLTFPLDLLGRSDTLSLVAEWKSPAFDTGWTRAFLVLVALTFVAVARRSDWRTTLPAIGFVAAALVSRRNIPVATLVVLPTIALGLPAIGSLDPRRSSPAIRFAFATVAAFVVVLPLGAVRAPHFDGSRYPEAAVDFMDENGLAPTKVRMVHQDFVGNYLGLRYRQEVAWIDDRFEIHSDELVSDYVVLLDGDAGWREVLERHRAEVILWPADAALTGLAMADGWSEAYIEDGWSILCHPGRLDC